MRIVCLQTILMKFQALIGFFNLKMLFAAILVGTLSVDLQL